MRWLRVSLMAVVMLTGIMIYPQTPTAPTSVTKEALEARIAELQKGQAQAMADYNAYSGAIQECQYWLDWLKKQKPPAVQGGTSSNKSH